MTNQLPPFHKHPSFVNTNYQMYALLDELKKKGNYGKFRIYVRGRSARRDTPLYTKLVQ